MKSWLSGAILLMALLFFGVIFGALVATRIMSSGGMGFDQLADALGGFIVGGALGLLAAIVLIRRLSPSKRLIVALIAIAGSFASVLYLRATPANIRDAAPVELPPPPVEPFSFMLQTSDPFEKPRQDDPSLPWDSLRIASNLSFSYVSHDAPNNMCIAAGALNTEDGFARLRELRSILENLDASAFPCDPTPCPTCTSVGLTWYIDENRFNIGFDDVCWRNEPTLQPFRSSADAIVKDYLHEVRCEPR
ncbi:MAG: hypothetical protein R3F50_01035 [Gammaproteobacteria bacterium]|jgi:hypothetical protein